MIITQKHIARELGVSLVTVNRALNNSGYVSAELKKRILDYVKGNSYVPHRASQVLVRNTIKTIAVFSSSYPEYFWNDIERGVKKAAEQIKFFNYLVHFHRILNSNTEKFCELLKSEICNGLNAVAFVNQRMFNMRRILKIVEKANIPYVMYNVDAPETNRLCYIGTDYGAGGRLAANFAGKILSMKKGSRVLIINTDPERQRFAQKPNTNHERQEAFLQVMAQYYASCVCSVVYLIDDVEDPFEKNQIKRILAQNKNNVDAVYFIPPVTSAFYAALKEFDYRDTIVIQHDMDEVAVQYLKEDLLTAVVFQDPGLQGFMAVRILENILENNIQERQKDIEISHTLILRENIDYVTSGKIDMGY